MANKQFIIKTSLLSCKKQIDSITLLGGKLYELELKLNKNDDITISDILLLKKHLSRINNYDQLIWNQLLHQSKEDALKYKLNTLINGK